MLITKIQIYFDVFFGHDAATLAERETRRNGEAAVEERLRQQTEDRCLGFIAN